MQTPWEHRFSQRTQRMQSSAISELLKVTELPGVISFAGGMPAPDVFPIEEVLAATERVLHGPLYFLPDHLQIPRTDLVLHFEARIAGELAAG